MGAEDFEQENRSTEVIQATAFLEDDTSAAPPGLADVLETIEALIGSHVLLTGPGIAMLAAVWIAGTYLYSRFQYYGYLALRSPIPRCGKSRLLRLVAEFAKGNPPVTMIPTAAALFRTPHSVLILDEVDRLRNSDKEKFGDVLAVLNSGFERSGVVARVEKVGGTWVVREFPTYTPKALAGIEALADTLADRAFMIRMDRSPARMPRLNGRRLHDIGQAIRKWLEGWAVEHGHDVGAMYDSLPDEVEVLKEFEDDRFQDIAEPLMVIATFADAERSHGKSVLDQVLTGLRTVSGRREPSGRERQLPALLELLEPRFCRLGAVKTAFISSSELLGLCQGHEELAWILTTHRLAGFLKQFDLRPGFNSAKTERGYTITGDWITHWQSLCGRAKKP